MPVTWASLPLSRGYLRGCEQAINDMSVDDPAVQPVYQPGYEGLTFRRTRDPPDCGARDPGSRGDLGRSNTICVHPAYLPA